MARIIVTTDNGTVTLDEEVKLCHLDNEHSAEQLIERLAWGLEDAERAVAKRAVTPYTADGVGA